MNTVKSNNFWQYRIGDMVSNYIDDETLINLIKNKKLNENTEITNYKLKKWYLIKDTIYCFYL